MFTQFSSFFSDALNSSSGHLKLCNSCHTDIHKYEGIRQGDTWTFEERGVPSLFSCDGMCSSYPNTIVLNQVLDVDTSLCPCLSIRDWMVPSDLKDMYLQVPIFSNNSEFLQFCIKDQVVQFKVFPLNCWRLHRCSLRLWLLWLHLYTRKESASSDFWTIDLFSRRPRKNSLVKGSSASVMCETEYTSEL